MLKINEVVTVILQTLAEKHTEKHARCARALSEKTGRWSQHHIDNNSFVTSI